MRVASSVLLVIAASAHLAHAGRIVLMTDPAQIGAQHAALQVTLRGTEITHLPPPDGELQLDRVATVERSVAANGADAGVWIEAAQASLEVCVVSADGKYLRHAPLPPDGSPRVFAAVATSLLDELLAPPEDAIHVDVHVDVTVPGAAVAAPIPIVAPAFAIAAGPSAMPAIAGERPAAQRALFEIGPMVSPLTVGASVGLAIPVSDHLRVGATGFVQELLTGDYDPVYGGGLEVRRVGDGRQHFDYGVLAGGAEAVNAGVGFVSVPLSYVWDRDSVGFALTIAPTMFFNAKIAAPAIWGGARMELPL